jgi:hypothetical protein
MRDLASFWNNWRHGRVVNILRNVLALCERSLLGCLLLLSLLGLLLGNNFTSLIVDIFRGGAAIMRGPRVRVVVLLGLGGVHLLEASNHVMLLVGILGLAAILA